MTPDGGSDSYLTEQNMNFVYYHTSMLFFDGFPLNAIRISLGFIAIAHAIRPPSTSADRAVFSAEGSVLSARSKPYLRCFNGKNARDVSLEASKA